MQKRNFKNGLLWAFTFSIIFLLTQDYLFINWEPSIGKLGLPNWIFWFMGIHVLFIIVFFMFSKKYWKD